MPTNARGKFPNKTPEDYLLEEGDLASNPETRTPVIICVDCSYSMRQQQRLDRVLEGLDTFCRDMERDPIARDSVELCLISYGGSMARVERDFATPDRLLEQGLPKLAAAGATPLADAVLTALENLELRKRRYRDNGITWYRPWLILIGDGDESQSPKELLLAEHLIQSDEIILLHGGPFQVRQVRQRLPPAPVPGRQGPVPPGHEVPGVLRLAQPEH